MTTVGAEDLEKVPNSDRTRLQVSLSAEIDGHWRAEWHSRKAKERTATNLELLQLLLMSLELNQRPDAGR